MIHVDKEMMKPIFFHCKKCILLMRIIRSIFELELAEIQFQNYAVKCLQRLQL